MKLGYKLDTMFNNGNEGSDSFYCRNSRDLLYPIPQLARRSFSFRVVPPPSLWHFRASNLYVATSTFDSQMESRSTTYGIQLSLEVRGHPRLCSARGIQRRGRVRCMEQEHERGER